MRLSKHTPIESDSSAIGQALEGFRYVSGHRRVLTILSLFAVVGIFGWSYSVLIPAFAQDVLHLGAHGYGMLMAGSGVGALAGALTVASAGHILPTRIMALGGIGIFSAALALFAFNKNIYVGTLLLAIVGFGIVLYFSTSNTVLQSIVPDEMRGRVMGIWTLIFGGMIPLGSLQAGLMADFLGTPATIAIGALICAIAALVTLKCDQKTRSSTGSGAIAFWDKERRFETAGHKSGAASVPRQHFMRNPRRVVIFGARPTNNRATRRSSEPTCLHPLPTISFPP